jgi:ATP-binding cassette, subfamily C (CFTR/MRP), member 1
MVGGSQQQTVFRAAPVPFPDELSTTKSQPLCGDPEGWGPISSVRYDFTPCFLDVWIVLVAAWGLVAGAGAIWFLLNKRSSQLVPKNWHFHAKLVQSSMTIQT